MQFICESCKANLQIADEKVRGKRLIVRCRRCGVQIRIVDPALGTVPGAARPATDPVRTSQSGSRPSTGPIRTLQPGKRPETGPIRTSQSGGRPSTGPIASASPARRETDTESTRAMDSEVLEKAVRASKGEEPGPARAAPRSAPPPPPRETAPARDPSPWFAMVHGEQTGPLTRAELALKAAAGQVGPRTYLWKEGMEAWIRAKDVPDLVPLFAAPPTPPPPPRENAKAAPAVDGKDRGIALPFEPAAGDAAPQPTGPFARAAPDAAADASPDAATPPGGMRMPPEAESSGGSSQEPQAESSDEPVAVDPSSEPGASPALDLARWGAAELSKPRAETPAPLPKAAGPGPARAATQAREFRAGEPERRGPLRAVLVVLALAVVGSLIAFALLYERKDAAEPSGAQGSGQAGSAQPAVPAETDQNKPKPGEAVPAALSAEDVKRKVEETKPALQDCIDQALRREPSMRVGKILISTTIAPSGAVTAARIDKKAVDQSPLGACLKSATQRMQFPPFSGEAFPVDIPIAVTEGE